MRDLRDFYNPNMTATINGHEFTVECPTAEEGVKLRMVMGDPEKARDLDDFDQINRLFKGDESNNNDMADEGKLPTGGLWDELWAHGVTVPEAFHLGVTAVMYFGIGENVAILHWESLGKGLTATEETKATEPDPAKPEEKPAPKPRQTRSRKKTD